MKPLQLSFLFAISLFLNGCITAPKTSHPDMVQYPTLETIEVEGYVIYYRDLSDPCDPSSTAWNNLRQRKHKGRLPENCSTPITFIPDTTPDVVIPDKEFVLLFAMRGKNLDSAENDEIVAELATMGAWPVRYQVFGAAGGEGATLENLGMKRAAVVKQGLVTAGVPETKIEIMPYDSSIPGLRAVVRLAAGEGV